MTGGIRVVVVDDHALVREGVRHVLDAAPDIDVVGEAGTAADARAVVAAHEPDVLVLDISLPDASGLDVAATVPSEHPGVRVLILSMHRHAAYVERAIEAGARGYVLKDAPPEDLRAAVRIVARGGQVFGAEADDPRLARLTPRERDVLAAIAEGFSNKEIAARLDISPRTVETHRESLMRKLDIHHVAGLTKFALQVGLASDDGDRPR